MLLELHNHQLSLVDLIVETAKRAITEVHKSSILFRRSNFRNYLRLVFPLRFCTGLMRFHARLLRFQMPAVRHFDPFRLLDGDWARLRVHTLLGFVIGYIGGCLFRHLLVDLVVSVDNVKLLDGHEH